jgi:cathepsin A (carboxypeptidase C)
LGPCLINPHGNGTTYNPHTWSTLTNLLFVDQPAGVGFSYVDKNSSFPSNSITSAADMAIFLQIFTTLVFPALQSRPLHLAGESYAGHYLPVLASRILHQNAEHPSLEPLALTSMLIGNGYVSTPSSIPYSRSFFIQVLHICQVNAQTRK